MGTHTASVLMGTGAGAAVRVRGHTPASALCGVSTHQPPEHKLRLLFADQSEVSSAGSSVWLPRLTLLCLLSEAIPLQ